MLLVLGSINIDLTVTACEIPKSGETIIGSKFMEYPGGKGANQAVCASLLGSNVSFLGKVGSDSYGKQMAEHMQGCGVDVSAVEIDNCNTGMALISVDEIGNNSIIVVPGANNLINREYIERHRDKIKNCSILLAQHETTIDATEYAFKIAKEMGKTTILNPAPAQSISKEMIGLVDILVPNEHELSRITGVESNDDVKWIDEACEKLLSSGVKMVIVTLGKRGVKLYSRDMCKSYPAFTVKPVDTTAAGDSFLGGFCTYYIENNDIDRAIEYGQLTASYTVQRAGAQSSMPNKEELSAYIESAL